MKEHTAVFFVVHEATGMSLLFDRNAVDFDLRREWCEFNTCCRSSWHPS